MDDSPQVAQNRFSYTKLWGETGHTYWMLRLPFVGMLMLAFGATALRTGSWLLPAVVLSFFIALVTLSYVLSVMRLCEVVINDLGISRYHNGKLRKEIPWTNVKYISVADAIGGRASIVYGHLASISYTVVVTPFPWCKVGTSFDDSIERLPQLIDIMNNYIQQYGIPVIDHRGGRKEHLNKIPVISHD